MNHLADGSVLDIRDTGLPATRYEKFITFCFYGVKLQNKIGASPATNDVFKIEMAVTPGNNATSLLARVTAPGLPCPAPIENRLKNMQPTPTEGRRII
jgi:hypothetical protein